MGNNLMKSLEDIQVFNNEKFGQVRVKVIDGTAWFVGKDVATALGYKNPQEAIREHVDEEDKGVSEILTPDGKQKTVVVNESGMNSLILSSKLPEAKEIRHWITSEIMPKLFRGETISGAASFDSKKSLSGITEDIVKTATILESYWGLKKGIDFVHSTTTAENLYGVNLPIV